MNARINYLNAIFMLASAVLAVFIPFELFLLSYAILGPAHYLTELSWLKQRQFFTLKRYDFLFILAVAAVCLVFKLPSANLVYYTLGLSFILLAVKNNISRVLAFIALVAAGYFLLTTNLTRTIFGLYIPTIVHVYIFTGAFLLFGAMKQKIVSGYVAFFTFLICPLLLCLLFTRVHIQPSPWAIENYNHFKRLNTISLRNQTINVYANQASIILTRLFAFAYTYHYINWFSKTKIINWHRIPFTWAVVIVLVWMASVGLYFYNYKMGIRWLFLLSLAHVILEFPLNYKSFAGIYKVIRQ